MKSWGKRNAGSDGPHKVRAAAIVEFAVVLPVLLAILFGIIEYGYVFMVRQSLQHAAREGGREASLQSSTLSTISAKVDTVMAPTRITSFTLGYESDAVNCSETVTVSVPYGDVSLTNGFFGMTDITLEGSCTMAKEGCTVGGG